MDRLRMRTNSRRSSVIIGFDYIYIYMYMYVCIYIHMLVRLDDYCKTVKLLQFS